MLPAVARRLASELGASRVVLFGSYATGDVHLGSDVDLATLGLPASRAGEAEALASRALGVVVEVFRLEDLPPAFRDRMTTEGASLLA